MTAIRRKALFSAAGAMVAAALVPAGVAAAAQPFSSGQTLHGGLPRLSYDLASYSPDSATPEAAVAPEYATLESASASEGASEQADDGAVAASIDQASLKCMAKVVHHESRGQPRRGMLAVAQTLMNRVKAGGRFGGTICAVANQPGQYFDTAAYHPNEESSDWQAAVDVSRQALGGAAEDAAHGALFFHAAAYRGANSFFRSRERVGTIGGQVFYR